MIQYKKYYMPGTKEELLKTIDTIDCTYDILAGGTDLYAKEKTPFNGADAAIDISGIKDFSVIELKKDEGLITFGSNICIQQFLEEKVLMENVPILRHAAIYFADQQIREMATVGGNVANSSPSGDTIAPLTVLEAVIHTITSKDNKICEKETPITEFITGVGKNLLEKGEVISSITCPVLKEYGCAFKKVGLRRSLCISTASSAFLVKADASKTHFEDVRIAFGAIGPVPRRLTEIEDRLKGEVISKERIQKMREYIPEDVVRSRSRKEYRRNVVENFTLAGIYEALAEIGIIPQ